jgi:hypothetical protein
MQFLKQTISGCEIILVSYAEYRLRLSVVGLRQIIDTGIYEKKERTKY